MSCKPDQQSCIYLSIYHYLSIYLSIYRSIHLSIYLSIYLYISIYNYIYIYVCLHFFAGQILFLQGSICLQVTSRTFASEIHLSVGILFVLQAKSWFCRLESQVLAGWIFLFASEIHKSIFVTDRDYFAGQTPNKCMPNPKSLPIKLPSFRRLNDEIPHFLLC